MWCLSEDELDGDFHRTVGELAKFKIFPYCHGWRKWRGNKEGYWSYGKSVNSF